MIFQEMHSYYFLQKLLVSLHHLTQLVFIRIKNSMNFLFIKIGQIILFFLMAQILLVQKKPKKILS